MTDLLAVREPRIQSANCPSPTGNRDKPSTTSTVKNTYSIPEAAEILGIGRTHMYELVRMGKIKVIGDWIPYRVPAHWLEEQLGGEIRGHSQGRREIFKRLRHSRGLLPPEH